VLTELLHRLERSEAIDRLAEPLEDAARPVVRREPLGRLLSGSWLGHRLHPLLTDAVIGSWLSAGILDLVGGRLARPHARTLVGVGIASSLPTAATGLHDWVDQPTKVRRAGAVHALANVVGLLLQTASWRARGAGDHRRGRRLSLAALGALGAGGYIGGHLTYVLGAGVERTAFDDAPSDWTPAAPLHEVCGPLHRVEVGGTAVLLVRRGERIDALADACGHLGCSLAEGRLDGDCVTCTCHGSRFRLTDGRPLSGPASAQQPAYDTRVRDGVVEVRER
jgi:nitrite reductase/ring-hydroxylating ferredoxin subunit